MNALFVLLPPAASTAPVDALLAQLPADLQHRLQSAQRRVYPRATDAAHLRSLLRTLADPLATRWRRGFVRSLLLGAGLGAATNAALAARGLLGGQFAIAVPLGAGVGTFLGAFTAAMTGTARPRFELRPLLAAVQPGDTLVMWAASDAAALHELAEHCARLRLPTRFVR